jgi:cell division GTPase FtsZ
VENIVEKETSMALVASAKSILLVAFIGNIGITAAKALMKKYGPKENPYLRVAVFEPNLPMLESCFTLDEDEEPGHLLEWNEPEHVGRFSSIQLGESGLGAGGDPVVGEALAREPKTLQKIVAVIAPCHHVLGVGGGGGGSVGALIVIAEEALKAGKTMFSLLTNPRASEGPKKAAKSKLIGDRMLGICPTMRIQNERIPDKKLTHSQVFQEINESSLFWILWLLKSMLQDRGDVVDLDGNDWRTGTSIGNFTVAGFYDASEGFDGLEKGLLGNPYLEPENIEQATWVGFWCKGKWSIADCERVDEVVRSKMRNQGRDAEVEFKWGIQEKGIPKGTKTIGFVSFAKEGPGSLEESRRLQVSIPIDTKGAGVSSHIEAPDVSRVVHEEVGPNGTNGIPAPPMAEKNGNGGSNGHKVSFEAVLNDKGDKVVVEALPASKARYEALFAVRNPTLETYQEAENVKALMFEETGVDLYVPSRPKSRW